MKSGLLWYDASKVSIVEKIKTAATRYQNKFGVVPNVCFLNPRDMPETQVVQFGEAQPKPIALQAKNTIMQNHLWLGVSA